MCIDLSNRCDQLHHCSDKSDELDCDIIRYDHDNYLSSFPPPPSHGQEKLPVEIGFDILQVDEINLQQYTFQVKFDIIVKWQENRFWEMLNLRNDSFKNSLTDEIAKARSLWWIPPIEFDNSQEDRVVLKFDETKGLEVVKQQFTSVPAGLDHLNEARIYKPSKNLLKLRASFKLVLKCEYKLLYYPFDAQHCFIKVLYIKYCFCCKSCRSISLKQTA